MYLVILEMSMCWYILMCLRIQQNCQQKNSLREVFLWLHAYKLQEKREKCEFEHAYVYYLGFIVRSGNLKVDMEKVAAIKNWPMLSYIRDI